MTPDATGPKSKPATKKVFDVMKPGKAIANPSARPIIVGHRPQVQDSVSGVGSEGPALQHRRKIELTHHEPTEEKASKPAPAEVPVAPKEETPKPKPEPKLPVSVTAAEAAVPTGHSQAAEAVPGPPAIPGEDPRSKTNEPDLMAPVFDAPSPQAQAMPPAPDTKIAFDDEPAPIPDNQEIIVSHHGPLDEPFKVIGLILLILILAVVAVDILLDADVLSIDALPRTDFFKP